MAYAPMSTPNASSRREHGSRWERDSRLTRARRELPPHEEREMATTLFKTKLCSFWQQGRCARTQCCFAHGMEELNVTPNLAKTIMCHFEKHGGRCRKRNCEFAHTEDELRAREPLRIVEAVATPPVPWAAAAPAHHSAWAMPPAAAATAPHSAKAMPPAAAVAVSAPKPTHSTFTSGGSTASDSDGPSLSDLETARASSPGSGSSTGGCDDALSQGQEQGSAVDGFAAFGVAAWQGVAVPNPGSPTMQALANPPPFVPEVPSPGSPLMQCFANPQPFVPEVGYYLCYVPVVSIMPAPMAPVLMDCGSSSTPTSMAPTYADWLQIQRLAEAKALESAAPEFYED